MTRKKGDHVCTECGRKVGILHLPANGAGPEYPVHPGERLCKRCLDARMEETQGMERSAVLCGDEFCLRVARYRLGDQWDVSRPVFLCEACYEKLSDSDKGLYKMRKHPAPVLLNKKPASGHGSGNCSGCGCIQ